MAMLAAGTGRPAAANVGPAPLVKADRVVVVKSTRQLFLLRGGEILKTYQVALGRNPSGPKVRQGDGRTPEGRYVLDWRNPESEFFRSIHISYPNRSDLQRAQQLGVPPGGNIMIHGLPNELGVIGAVHSKWDWTEGCIAVTNDEMLEIWHSVDDGTPIVIHP